MVVAKARCFVLFLTLKLHLVSLEREIWFYDNYVIPLAKKLKDCGVLGVSSDEYLTYAENNRNEWEEKGEDIVKSMVEKYRVMMDSYEPKKPESKAKGKAKNAK